MGLASQLLNGVLTEGPQIPRLRVAMCIYIYIYMCMCMCVYIYIHNTYIYIYTHTHTLFQCARVATTTRALATSTC